MKSSERKHLRLRVFHKNKDSWSKDQSQFNLISPAMKGNVNRTFFHGEIKCYFGSHVNTLLEEERMTISLSTQTPNDLEFSLQIWTPLTNLKYLWFVIYSIILVPFFGDHSFNFFTGSNRNEIYFVSICTDFIKYEQMIVLIVKETYFGKHLVK